MNTVGKWITYLVLGALVVLIITHPVGFALDSTAAGKVGNQTLDILSGSAVSGQGSANLQSDTFSVG